ncbi:SNF2-related protein [Bosea sp. TWI1241]|uniref:SNF2-related protein n=1 Tax=Bosea sp. TWI1241 TaxID=3148904 RepID=UPI00320AE7EF
MNAIARHAQATAVYGELAHLGGRWVMSGAPPHVALKLKAMFPAIRKDQVESFGFRDTPEVCADLDWFTQRYPMAMSAQDRKRLRTGKASFQRSRDEIEAILLPQWTPPPGHGLREGRALYHGQAQAVALLLRTGRLLCMDDVGLGKTLVALGALASSPQHLPAAIVVQAHLPSQWVKEFIAPFTHLRAHIVEGRTPYDLPPADLYIFRYSNICGWADIAATGFFKAVVFDEIQELRHGSKTAKGGAAKVFCDHAQLRLGLSATPVFNYGSEIFNILEFLAPGLLGDWEDFVREWCSGQSGKWVVRDPDALGTYLREMQVVIRRRRQGRKVNSLVIDVESDEAVEQEHEALARSLAMRVVSGSFVDRGQAARELDAFARMVTGVAKARSVAAYVRILLEAGTPVILAGWHRDVYEIWLTELAGFRPVLYTGSESPAQKDSAKAAFMAGETDLFVISLRSGSGLDGLQHRCATVCIGELDWTAATYEQLVGRVDRPGQKADEIDALYFVSGSGSDPLVIEVNGLKKAQARGIVDPLAGVAETYSNESRIRLLAQRYLDSKHREPAP